MAKEEVRVQQEIQGKRERKGMEMRLPKPYYQDDSVTVYNCDWRDYASYLPKVDLLLTDPPYGIEKDGQEMSTGKHGGRKAYDFKEWDKLRPSKEEFHLIRECAEVQIIWGGNYFADLLPPSMRWLVWDKGQRINQSDGELAWTSMQQALRILTMNRVELMSDGAIHPTQKPVKLFTWCISQAPESVQTILDPYAGSLTTGVAAKAMGKKSILFEREEKYCEKGVSRLCQEVLI